MNKAQERVAIAKDALAWVKAGALIPTKMVSFESVSKNMNKVINSNIGKQLRDVKLGQCKVCCLGGMFLAKAVRFDEVEVAYDYMHMHQKALDKCGPLSQHFNPDQLVLIEKYFEGWTYGNKSVVSKFAAKYPQAKQRMVAILKNIIANDGEFIPEV